MLPSCMLPSHSIQSIQSTDPKKFFHFNFSGPPNKPDLIVNRGSLGINRFRKGEKLEISCSAPSGRPAANVSLFLG